METITEEEFNERCGSKPNFMGTCDCQHDEKETVRVNRDEGDHELLYHVCLTCGGLTE